MNKTIKLKQKYQTHAFENKRNSEAKCKPKKQLEVAKCTIFIEYY